MRVKNDIAEVFALQNIRGGWNDHLVLVSTVVTSIVNIYLCSQ